MESTATISGISTTSEDLLSQLYPPASGTEVKVLAATDSYEYPSLGSITVIKPKHPVAAAVAKKPKESSKVYAPKEKKHCTETKGTLYFTFKKVQFMLNDTNFRLVEDPNMTIASLTLKEIRKAYLADKIQFPTDFKRGRDNI